MLIYRGNRKQTRHSPGLGIVAKSVGTRRLRDSRSPDSVFDSLLQYRFVNMVPPLLASDSVGVMAGCGKHPLPPPLFPCVWIFAFQRVGQGNATQTLLNILLVLSFDALKMCQEWCLNRAG